MSRIKSILTCSLVMTFVTPTFAQHVPPNDMIYGGADGGEDMSGEDPKLKEAFDIFMKDLPADSFEALKYIIAKLNLAEAGDAGKNMVFGLNIFDTLPDGKIMDLKPRFGSDNHLYLDLHLKKSLVNNPVYILEAMAQLQGLIAAGSSYEIGKIHKYSIKQHHSYFNDKGEYIVDYTKTVTVHGHYLISKNAVEALGVQKPAGNQINALGWSELKINADKGSAYAKHDLAAKEVNIAKAAMNSFVTFLPLKNITEAQKAQFVIELARERKISVDTAQPDLILGHDYFTKRVEGLQAEVAATEKLARAQYTQERAALENPAAKTLKQQLEDQKLKLNDLVKANDREGVAKLLEAFIPLSIMEPIEKELWLDWIEAIRRPDPKKKTLLFRGLDKVNDHPQTVLDAQKKEVGHGFFSVLLNKNQGNFTRRLRSVAVMRYKFQNLLGRAASPVEVMPSMSSMMTNHSSNPVGSPFMSFTTDKGVAAGFGGDFGILAAHIDSRRVLPNITSVFSHEIEMLVPLIVFPDEVLVFQKVANGGPLNMEEFVKKLDAKLGRSHLLELESNAKNSYVKAYSIFANAEPSSGGQCGRVFVN